MTAARATALACLAFAACGPGAPTSAEGTCPAFSERGDVRVFTVAHRLTLSDALNYDTFEASYRRHLDAVRPCLSADRPNLLVFPEDSGLVAWFIGRQALAGRHAASSGDAFNGLYAQAMAAADAYRVRYPGISSARGLTLALSDRAWRAIDRTFGGIARDSGAWVLTSANLPVSTITEGEEATVFGDPDGDGSAYVASGPELFNAGLAYAPDGARVGRVDKAFLTTPEEDTLDLSNGPLSTMEVLGLPFGRVGVAISRDAFYPPFAQRLDDLGAELVVQPEAFSGWAGEEHPGDWLPDVMLSAGWALTQKYASVRATAAPMLTGNLFDFFFDGQAFITQKADGTTGPGFVGQDPLPGFVAVSPWAFDEDPGLAQAERRAQLREMGKRLLPASGTADEGHTFDGFVAADVALHGGPPVAVAEDPARASIALDAARPADQRNVALAFDVGGRLYVAFEEDTAAGPRIRLATSTDGGKSFFPSTEVSPSRWPQRRPTLATVGAGVVAVAWQEGLPGAERVRALVSKTAGGRFDRLTVEDAGAVQWEPAVTIDDDGQVWLAWTDFRSGLAPEVRLARYGANARTAPQSCAIDASTRDLPRTRASQYQPALTSLNGLVGVAWLDGRNADWEVHARVSRSPCDEGTEAPRVSMPDDTEVLAGDPAWATSPDGRLLLSWDEIRNRLGFHDVNGAQWQSGVWTPLQLSPTLTRPRYRPSPVFKDGLFQVYVQDLATDRSTIGRMELGPLGFPADPVRADGVQDAAVSLHHPRVAVKLAGASGVLTYEDTRDGHRRIRVQQLQPP